ncbi:hypothetical protein J7L05_11885 [bacterium]|nr:hypothetical protein [bacterium]
MKISIPKRILYLSLSLCMIITILVFYGCGNNANVESKADKESERIVKSESLPYVAIYSRLTYEKFQEIRDDTYPVSYISINYARLGNYDQYNRAQEVSKLSLKATLRKRTGNPFTLFIDYDGYYYYVRLDVTPDIYESKKHTFSANEINAIFDYLEENDNEDYFFNGLEYTGLPQPYESPSVDFDDTENANQYVTIGFREPGTIYNEWAISKSMFADDPHPILQGLIDILEDDFISQFE